MILEMTLGASVMIILAILIRVLFLHQLSKRVFYVIWGLIVLRLLIPFTISLPVNIWTIETPLPQENVEVNFNLDNKPISNMIEITTQVEKNDLVLESVSNINWLQLIWISGVVISGLIIVSNHLKFRKWMSDSILVDILHNQRIQIRETNKVNSPLTYGLFKPIILIPRNMDLNDDQLEIILTHEYVHIQSRDFLKKIILSLALCIHWFNPLVWVMVMLANRDIELICDEEVLRILGKTKRKSYVMTLLEMEEKRHQSLALAFSKNATEERVNAMFKMKKKKSILGGIAALSLIGITMVMGAANPVEALVAQAGGWEARGFSVVQRGNIDEWIKNSLADRAKQGATEADIEWFRDNFYADLDKLVQEGGVIVELGDSTLTLPAGYELLEIDGFENWREEQLDSFEANNIFSKFTVSLIDDAYDTVLARLQDGVTIVRNGTRFLELDPLIDRAIVVVDLDAFNQTTIQMSASAFEHWIDMRLNYERMTGNLTPEEISELSEQFYSLLKEYRHLEPEVTFFVTVYKDFVTGIGVSWR